MFNSGSRKCSLCVYMRCSFDKLVRRLGFDVFSHEVSRTSRKGMVSGGAAAADTKEVLHGSG